MNSEFFGQMPRVPHLSGVAAFLVHLYSPCSGELPGNPEGRDVVQMSLPRESQAAHSQGGIWELHPTCNMAHGAVGLGYSPTCRLWESTGGRHVGKLGLAVPTSHGREQELVLVCAPEHPVPSWLLTEALKHEEEGAEGAATRANPWSSWLS